VPFYIIHVIKGAILRAGAQVAFFPMSNASEYVVFPGLNVMAALPNIGGAICSTPQSLADAHH